MQTAIDRHKLEAGEVISAQGVLLEPEFKAQWIAALLSNEYVQAQGSLCNGHGYCCLGVAGNLIDETAWGSTTHIEDEYQDFFTLFWHGRSGTLPEGVFASKLKRKDGITVIGPTPDEELSWASYEIQSALSCLNDSNVPFSDIADVINTYL